MHSGSFIFGKINKSKRKCSLKYIFINKYQNNHIDVVFWIGKSWCTGHHDSMASYFLKVWNEILKINKGLTIENDLFKRKACGRYSRENLEVAQWEMRRPIEMLCYGWNQLSLIWLVLFGLAFSWLLPQNPY